MTAIDLGVIIGMNWTPFLFLFVASVVAYFVATHGDVKKYYDPKKRSQVVEVFTPDMTKRQVTKAYLWVNFREVTLFIGGMIAGLMAVMWGVAL